MHRKNAKRSTGENRPVRFFPDAHEARSITTHTKLKSGVKIVEGKTYLAKDIIDSDIFKENPQLKKAEIVIRSGGVPAEYNVFGDQKIYINSTSGKNTLEIYLDHELQHKHDVETLGLFKNITEKNVGDITQAHEKRAYITTFRSALERGYSEKQLRATIQNDQDAATLSQYLDEALLQASPQTSPKTS